MLKAYKPYIQFIVPNNQNIFKVNSSGHKLKDFRRRLMQASLTYVNFCEIDSYQKPTNRFVVPLPYYNIFSQTCRSGRITLGFEGQLLLLPSECWDEYLAEINSEIQGNHRNYIIDELIRNSHLVEFDSKHRIKISEHLVASGKLGKRILCCPAGTIEIWDEQVYAEYRSRLISGIAAMARFP